MITIGAAIITKNAELSIGRALDSIKDICSQIVVVDTGSTDSTPMICSRFGVELYFHLWENDFSKARNTALSYLNTDWVLSIDSDEELINEAALGLSDNSNVGGLNLKIKNLIENSSAVSEHRYTRIFRNLPELKYSGTIHEQIRPSIEAAGFEVVETDITILHHGYNSIDPAKLERNKSMLGEEILSSEGGNAWLNYHLANTEFGLKNFDRAGDLYLNSIASGELSAEQVEMSKIRLAQISLSMNQFARVVELLDFNSDNIDTEGLRKYVAAAAYINSGDYSIAYEYYKSYEVTSSMLVSREIVSKALSMLEQILSK